MIDRVAAARLGVRIQDIDNALNNAFSQRQISTIYAAAQPVPRRSSRSIRCSSATRPISRQVYVAGAGGTQVPLSAVAAYRDAGCTPGRSTTRASSRPSPSASTLQPDVTLSQDARRQSDQAVAELHLPDTLHAEFAGDAASFRRIAERPAAVHPRRAACGLYRARRALREPRPSADHHLDAAVRRPRRAAGAATVPCAS